MFSNKALVFYWLNARDSARECQRARPRVNDLENMEKVNLAESGKNDQIRKKIYTLRTLRVKYWTLSYFQNRIYYGGNDYNSKISAIKPYKRANENSVRKAFESLHSDWPRKILTYG